MPPGCTIRSVKVRPLRGCSSGFAASRHTGHCFAALQLRSLHSLAFAALLPVKAVGVQGDRRTYDQVIVLRAITSEDFMTADWFDFPPKVLRRISGRITNEVAGVNRCVRSA